MNGYLRSDLSIKYPRLPLDGTFDLTYRCDNSCRHCWLRLPPGAEEEQAELSIDEIKSIVDQARRMGCRSWHISGGEPMMRSDFPEIFDYITGRSISYTINTNGTLITPEIAELFRRDGRKFVALYGASAKVHDYVTRNLGSFEATMKGFELLKDIGAEFTVQLIPMKDNYHQFQDMVKLAKSLSPRWRVGAPWLYLSACGSPKRNEEIAAQRLSAKEVIALDNPKLLDAEGNKNEHSHLIAPSDGMLFASCAQNRREFHIDPYGQMTFCGFIKDPNLRYNLREGSFQEAWEEFIPSLADKVQCGKEYSENCGSCNLRSDCRWCPVYAFLEHGRYCAKIDYLCEVAKEAQAFKDDWKRNHRRYYQIAGITIQVDSDLPITDATFHPMFRQFQADGPGLDMIFIQHHFDIPNLSQDLGREVFRKPPWAIFRKGKSWIYLGIYPNAGDPRLHKVAIFNDDHSYARIFNLNEDVFLTNGLTSLTLFPSDQLLLARVLAERKACILHSAGMILEGKGLLFVGHSGAGKSTMVKMMKDTAEILCDDRNIVRHWPDGFRVHGTWAHGEVPLISSASAPMTAILFLKKSDQNCITLLVDRKEIMHRLMACLVKPLATSDWWQKMITLLAEIAIEVPCYEMEFDRSGGIVLEIENLRQNRTDCKMMGR
jgi:MoaA/NifB/PqqE/SkfB family radical SAM enzyme